MIDEAHNVARGDRGLLKEQVGRVAGKSFGYIDFVIGYAIDGRPESFASLMNMLDPTAIADESNYTKEDIRDLYVRRFKKDVLRDLRQVFPNAK